MLDFGMSSQAIRSYRQVAVYALAVAFLTYLVVAVSTSSYGPAAVMMSVLLLLIAVKAGSSFGSLTLLYVVLLVLAEFLKRAVFVFETQNPQSQYIVLAIPSVLLLYLVIRTFWEGAYKKPDTVSIAFFLFIAVLIANTWLFAGSGFRASILASGYVIFPMMAFFVFRKAAEDPRFIDGFCLTIVVLGAVMAPYGVLQFFCGPGPIETAWAEASYGFSLQAKRVHSFLAGGFGKPYMRAFSLYTDNFSFGYFEAAAMVALAVYRFRNRLRRSTALILGTLIFTGLVSSYARSPWFALIVCVALYFAASVIRRLSPIALTAGLVLTYFLLTFLAGWVSEQVAPTQRFSDPYTKGAFSAGSLQARTQALPAFIEIVKNHPIAGRGIGAGYAVGAKVVGFRRAKDPVDDRHNYFGNLVWQGGLPALLLLLFFLHLIIVRGQRLMLARDPVVRKTNTLMLSFVLALVLSSAFGQSPFQGFLLAWCALICTGGSQPERSMEAGKNLCSKEES